MSEKQDNVNRFAACSRCANNGCKFCPECDGYLYWKFAVNDPVVLNKKDDDKREYQSKYFQEHKAEIREKRCPYFKIYYHEVLKKNPEAVELRRARSLKYYYDHKDEITEKRNAKKNGIMK